MAYNSLDPNNAWTEDSFWDPPEFSEFSEFEETPMTDSQRKDLDERLRRYHEDVDDSQPCKPVICPESDGSSSSGTTLAPNTPDAEVNLDDSVVDQVQPETLVVLDTPDRPGYVEPELSPRSSKRCERRRRRKNSGSRQNLCFDDSQDDLVDPRVKDLYKFHPHLARNNRGESSEPKK